MLRSIQLSYVSDYLSLSRGPESNRQPSHYKCDTLPIELPRLVVRVARLELTLSKSQISRITNFPTPCYYYFKELFLLTDIKQKIPDVLSGISFIFCLWFSTFDYYNINSSQTYVLAPLWCDNRGELCC